MLRLPRSVVPSFPLLIQCRMVENPSAYTPVASRNLYANVIVPRHIAGSFTYIVPAHLKPVLRIGHCVVVPFGRARVQGAVISLSPTLPAGLDRDRLKEIGSIIADNGSKEIPSHLLELAKRISDYYVAPWGQCLRLVMPPSSPDRAENGRCSLTLQGREALTAGVDSEEVRSVLQRLSRKPAGIKRATLLNHNRSKQQELLETLLRKGWIVELFEKPDALSNVKLTRFILPSNSEARPESAPLSSGSGMMPDQGEELIGALSSGQPVKIFLQAPLVDRISLLHRAISHTLAGGRTVLVIVGETERARWLTERLTEEGAQVSACLHSGLSDDERAAIWLRSRQPGVQVIVGTRSAIFLPVRSLGMIWVERSEDSSLKEPQEPRYHARDVAWLRAQDERAALVLGSPYPALEASLKTGAQDTVLRYESPVALQPKVELVDLRPLGKGIVLSPSLIEAMHEAIVRDAGVLLFLNRKGYAGALICGDCGQFPRCNSCRVALPYYRRNGRLVCPYCGTGIAIPGTCAFCAGHRLRLIGEGTERVEEEVGRLFPGARLIRADGDTMRKPAQAATLWKAIKERQWDVLIGTQLVLRDHAVPSVGLVGIVQADAGLSLPDFRAAERTYHMLRDAVTLARPSSDGGRVIIQSYLHSHHAMQAVFQWDESRFISEELSHRIALGYPPAVHLIALHVSGANEGLVEKAAVEWVGRLQAVLTRPVAGLAPASRVVAASGPDEFTVLGPVPPPIPRVRGRYRRQILVKSVERERGIQAVRESIEQLEQAYQPRAVKFDVDADPVEMW